MILRTLDPAEVNFEFDQATMFRDLETGREIYVDPQTAVEDYQRRFQEHESEIKQTCDQLGVQYFQIQTDQPLETALLNLLQSRANAGKTVKRAVQAGGSR